MKALVIDALRKRYRLKELLPVLAIGKSSWCYYSKAAGTDRYKKLRIIIRRLFEENDGRYGYRRIHHLFEREGMTVSEKVVRRIMRDEGLAITYMRKRRYSSYKGEISPEVPNLIARDFHADRPERSCLPTLHSSASHRERYISLLYWTAMTGWSSPGASEPIRARSLQTRCWQME